MSKERDVVTIKNPPVTQQQVVQVNQGSGETPDVQIPSEADVKAGITADMSEEEKAGRRRMAEFFALPIEEQVAKVATILDRGILHDRLKVDLPPDIHGEWARNDPLEISRMQTLGFWVDNTYATKRQIHSDGSSSNVIGDVIHMCTLKSNKEMIDKVRMEQVRRQNMSRKQKQKEEDEFASDVARATGEVIPTFVESSTRTATASDVRAALARADAQTQKQR